MNNYIIFDMDGVLLDSEPVHMEVERRLFEQLKIKVTEKLHHSFVGMAPRRMWEITKKEFQLLQEVDELLELDKTTRLEAFMDLEIKASEHLETLLADLKKNNFSLSIASSSPKKLIELITERLQIRHYFDILISGEEVENGKPHPDIFLKAASFYQKAPKFFTVIEDSTNGILAAKAAGMKCIAYRNPNSGKQDLSKADLIIDSFSELNIEEISRL